MLHVRTGAANLLIAVTLASCGPGPAAAPGAPSPGGSVAGTSGGNANDNPGPGATPGATPATLTAEGAVMGPGSAPVTLSGTAGGPYASSVIGAPCTGYTSALPSHILEVTEDLGQVSFVGSATIDTVLFVRTPSGEMLCDDDGGGYPNPSLTHATPAGRYQIWYGTYSPGEGAPYTLTITVLPPPRTLTATAFAGVPSYCGMSTPVYGPITIGTSVVLGAHTGWTGSDGGGGTVTDDTWWNDSMFEYVGQRTTVTELPGLDPVGCPYVRVAIDGGTWGWRIRDLSP